MGALMEYIASSIIEYTQPYQMALKIEVEGDVVSLFRCEAWADAVKRESLGGEPLPPVAPAHTCWHFDADTATQLKPIIAASGRNIVCILVGYKESKATNMDIHMASLILQVPHSIARPVRVIKSMYPNFTRDSIIHILRYKPNIAEPCCRFCGHPGTFVNMGLVCPEHGPFPI